MKHTVWASVMVLAVVSLLSCAGTPQPPITSPEVTVRLAPDRDLQRHAVSYTSDPFLAPGTLLMPQNEFVTLVVNIALPQTSRVEISGDVENASGTSVARLYEKAELRDYWLARGRAEDPAMVQRLKNIETFYAPSLVFTAKPGRWEYYVVMIGKRPIPRPAQAVLRVSLAGSDPQSFQFDLPPFKN